MTMTIHLSDAAAERISELMTDPDDLGLWIGVTAGGCAGFQYRFYKATTDNTPPNADYEIISSPSGEALLFVEPEALKMLDGATLDYEKTIMTQQFVVKNPNADVTCGCGISFQ